MSQVDMPSGAGDLAAGLPATARLSLVTAALAEGVSTLRGVTLDETVCSILQALSVLGVRTRVDESLLKFEIVGCAGHWPEGECDLGCANRAVLGILAFACCTGWGRYRLIDVPDGALEPDPGMLAALRDLGVAASHDEQAGRLPLDLRASGLTGATVKITSPGAGQWLGAFLVASACSRSDVFIEMATPAFSLDTVGPVLRLMEVFGVSLVGPDDGRIVVPAPQVYRAAEIDFSMA
ncbi:MAG TPA: hypothetical protein PKY77_04055 [Phycisphaerae bacterium]|nr:hypothetical protein [Phycisphaerae bacterium]HRY67054.1 hypothetical protein [Phycisphaerae bacterium]HSA27751.1 hypothetical protein [Phycisphaerae bacterium]